MMTLKQDDDSGDEYYNDENYYSDSLAESVESIEIKSMMMVVVM